MKNSILCLIAGVGVIACGGGGDGTSRPTGALEHPPNAVESLRDEEPVEADSCLIAECVLQRPLAYIGGGAEFAQVRPAVVEIQGVVLTCSDDLAVRPCFLVGIDNFIWIT